MNVIVLTETQCGQKYYVSNLKEHMKLCGYYFSLLVNANPTNIMVKITKWPL